MTMIMRTDMDTLITPKSEGAALRVSHLRATFGTYGGQTRLEAKFHNAPIKIAKAFPLGGPLGVIVMDVSPGLLEGDCYDMAWNVQEGAHVYVTNQSYTKVHPSSLNTPLGSRLNQRFVLGEQAVVESMPEPVMLYKDALFAADTRVELAPGAVWMQAEVLCPGRTLRGELFHYQQYRSKLQVLLDGELIFAQNQRIVPADQMLSAPGCLAEMTHTGVFYAFSDRLASRHIEAVRQAIEAWPGRPGQQVSAGVTATHKHGLAVMAAGTTAWALQEVLAVAWGALRQELLGLAPLKFSK
ncbi:urease accessory protein [Paenibacillus phyllosphaerae]|uniref:Urease accessory protein UreD n=1 Tax=Paenibacillus phyllosphaerae TaxID=274593 RepID=A0A7W5FKM5_9BACL|nr:urease accessory protein UreD [Paenibacillus phyllosphaerae]MBB3108208.1 urease accessory protein [Paenibacillus phyllosphaerae]